VYSTTKIYVLVGDIPFTTSSLLTLSRYGSNAYSISSLSLLKLKLNVLLLRSRILRNNLVRNYLDYLTLYLIGLKNLVRAILLLFVSPLLRDLQPTRELLYKTIYRTLIPRLVGVRLLLSY